MNYFSLFVCFKFIIIKQNKLKNLQKYFHPSFLNQIIYAHMHCNAESIKRSAEGFNFKEDDRAFPF